jgi:fructose-1-phosphate kinase PfkB-like protein
MWEASPPRVDAISPIGAGDALAAATTWSLAKGDAFSDALRWGVAAGSAKAKLPGMTYATLEQTREVYEDADLRWIEP